MNNNWIQFVKEYAEENGITYKEAMIEAKQHYKTDNQMSGSAQSNYIYKDN